MKKGRKLHALTGQDLEDVALGHAGDVSGLIRYVFRRGRTFQGQMRDVVQRLAAVRREIIDGLLTAPSHRVQPCVQYEAHCTPHVVRERTESRVRVRVQAEVVPERLGVESP